MKKCPWIGAVLFISLGFNLFALGYMMGKPPVPHEKQRGPHFEMMAEKAKDLPPEQREKVMAIVKQYRPEIRDGFKDMQKARKDVDALMKSDSYNREEAEALFAKLSESASRAYKAAQSMMMDIADALPPESRAMMMPKPREHGSWSKKGQRPPIGSSRGGEPPPPVE